ncbi:MAG: AraC family transcriptional regulator [Cytophagales bacterium]
MVLHIKNMVCDRCIMAVSQAIAQAGLKPIEVTLGVSTVEDEPTQHQIDQLQNAFERLGFELLVDKKHQVIAIIKAAVIKLVQKDFENEFDNINTSDYLTRETGYEYSYISNLFSTSEHITIEKYIILQKTERIKELVSYGEYNLSQIADKMGYSSVHALSNQFKKITGFSPTDYKAHAIELRKPLDKISLINTGKG